MVDTDDELWAKHSAAIVEWAPHGSDCFVELPDGALACVHRLMFTHAILHGVSERGCESRWCYGSHVEAEGALRDWVANFDKQPEPVGWIRRILVGRFAKHEVAE